jgi:CRP-like cAMP-binding protein
MVERNVDALRAIPLFSGLPPARLKLIAYTSEFICFEPGEVIVQEGDPADAVYIIAEGEAEVLVTDAVGRRIRLAGLGPCSLFGETGVLARGRRTATVQAKDRVVAFKIAGGVFLDLLRLNPEIAMPVMRALARMLERTSAALGQRSPRVLEPELVA